jgi:glycosyltransferase involved in cell wall biosynthesis
MKKTLRILMVLHMPWTKNLGAPRVQYEIAEELREMGHIVDKFDLRDAFPHPSKISSFFEQSFFSRKAADFVRCHGHKYDVIDAHQANLPFSKNYLGFNGLLCARSCGLGHFFIDYKRQERNQQRLRGEGHGTLAGNAIRALTSHLEPKIIDYEKSFFHADIINVLNQDEYKFVSESLNFENKTVLFPHGLRKNSFQLFEQQRCQAVVRYQNQKIVFIGNWSERKGSLDFPSIVQAVINQNPAAKFLFLGASCSSELLLSKFPTEVHPNVEVIPEYQQANLPNLISDSTLAVFPSYCEGFPWSVLEKLAAGLPVIAYDIHGVRDMLKHYSQSMMTDPGDIQALSNKLVEKLNQPIDQYAALVEESLSISRRFQGRDIAQSILNIYEEKLDKLHFYS